MAAKVLLVEDDRALREALSDTLLLGGHEFVAVDSAEAALPVLAREAFSLVISDVNMPGMDGHQLLGLIRTRYPHLPVLLMTAYGAVDRAVEAMRQGAADYLVKPFEARALLDLVARHALGQLPGSEEDGPVALEPASRQLLELAARVARSDSTVLISGESGTGKEVLANYIHQQSPRAGKPFIAINCAAIPDNMLEATLFGHEKGSFTGAIAAQPGKFELADGGTILLDEISEMPLGLQAKLLRVLQEREVERVGARKPINLDIRVLATTNRMFIHAERNQDIEVENDETHWVGHDRTKTIDHDETVHVKHDRTETVDNNETITVHANRSKTVDRNETVRIGMNKTETILMASLQNVGMGRMENVGLGYSLNVGMMMNTVVGLNQSTQVMKKKTLSVGDSYEVSVGGSDDGSKITLDGQSITLGSQRIELTADREILLRCGQSTIRLTPGEIEILSPNVDINC